MAHEEPARWWEPASEQRVHCALCPHSCMIAAGGVGRCKARENRDGALVAAAYGTATSLALDPIEKKPLYHFMPGSKVLSVGSYGCNLSCDFCQNHGISQNQQAGRYVSPEELVQIACEEPSNVGIAYTYNEPLVGWEYVYDCAQLARERGLANVLVSNGFVSPRPFAQIAPLIDAINLDIKSFEPEFYTRLCGGALEPVLEAARIANQHMLVEVTNLVITGENDTPAALRDLAEWIAQNLGRDTPLHYSRYRPAYRLSNPPTPEQTLLDARQAAMDVLDHVYLGNMHAPGAADTRCRPCGATLIGRSGYVVQVEGLSAQGECMGCGAPTGITTAASR